MIEVGVDIGGTFTDVVCRVSGQPMRIMKLPTTRQDPSAAVIASISRMVQEWGLAPRAIRRFVHGTTVATNAVLERRGPKVGLLTTAGFKDVLEIGRQMRQQMYKVVLRPETPVFLAPGAMRKEARERIGADGAIVIPLDEASVEAAAAALVQQGAEAIAICFLHSYLNPTHEQRAAAIIRASHPGLYVSLSCEVDPAFREYERSVVTAFDAYIKPVIDSYLGNLEAGLRNAGVSAPLQVMQSRGGVAAAVVARTRPVRLFLSGPAAGVIGARTVGSAMRTEDLISVDIGGTSCDIALVCAGKPLIRAEGVVDGYPIRVPMVDVNAIGAGGGSIAWIDGAGGLRVGPRSAGSDPGPACYNAGGREATVTDASVVLGYIDPDYFAGGTLKLDPALARAAIAEKIARPLGLSLEHAALGIHRVVNAQMTEGIRLVSIRQGFDPRPFALLALGGGGGLHATALADELGIGRVLLPRHPGVLSAAGLLAAEIEHEVSLAFPRGLGDLSMADVAPILRELDARCASLMAHEPIDASGVERHYFADVCYVGQSHYLEVPIELADPCAMRRVYAAFVAAHDRVFGHSTDAPARIVNLRAVHRLRNASTHGPATPSPLAATAPKARREIMLPGAHGPVTVDVYAREAIGSGTEVVGPAIIEQVDTTTLVGPGWQARLAEQGNLLLARRRDQ
jgi:N-methylhydantoinase A/oxoprolinase/acetone carboxylase beta subunit